MIPAGNGGSPTVAVDPAELDRAAGRLRGQGLDAYELVCRLPGTADGVDMPPEVQARVRAAVDSAVAGLDGLGGRLDALADFVWARALATRRVDDPATMDAAFVAMLAGGRALARYRPYLEQLDRELGTGNRLLNVASAAAELRKGYDSRQMHTSPDPAGRSRAARDLPRSVEISRNLDRISRRLGPAGDVVGATNDLVSGKSVPDVIWHRGAQAAGGAAGGAASAVCGPLAPACAVPFSVAGAEAGDRAAGAVEEEAENFFSKLSNGLRLRG